MEEWRRIISLVGLWGGCEPGRPLTSFDILSSFGSVSGKEVSLLLAKAKALIMSLMPSAPILSCRKPSQSSPSLYNLQALHAHWLLPCCLHSKSPTSLKSKTKQQKPLTRHCHSYWLSTHISPLFQSVSKYLSDYSVPCAFTAKLPEIVICTHFFC